MMQVTNDFYVKCNRCGQIAKVETDSLEYDTAVYDRPMGEEIEYNFLQQSKNNNLLFTKRSELGDINTKTLLITTTYFNSNNEFSPKNISIIFEILRLFENFTKKYHLSILFVNNSSSFSNSIDSSLNDVLYLDILSIIYLQFENTLNKVNVLNLNT